MGGFGFIGTNLLKHIDENLNSQYRVVVLDRVASHPDGLSFDCVNKVYVGDFGDRVLMNSIFDNNAIDYVFHFISVSVPSSSSDCVFDLNHNVIPTVQLLSIMNAHGVRKIVFLSSGGAVYGDKPYGELGHNETEVLYPKSPYGISKLVIEKYLFQHYELFDILPLVLRLSNPYGKYHYSKKQGVVNIAMRNANNHENINIWGDGNGKKDYIFVEDFCVILFALVNKNVEPMIVNVGSGSLLSVNEIAKIIKQLYPEFSWTYSQSNKLDVSDFKLDLTQLNKLLGDFKYTSFVDGIRITNDWLQSKK